MVPPRAPSFKVPVCRRSQRAGTGKARTGCESASLHFGFRGEVAQLVEHTAENRGVAGSSPALAIFRTRQKSAGADFRRAQNP
jgi:hypothetical protein